MKLFLAVVLLSLPSFAAEHFIGKTLEPTGKLTYFAAKKSMYPVRHPVSTTKGVAKAVAATSKAIF
jgi:hypothetical protein